MVERFGYTGNILWIDLTRRISQLEHRDDIFWRRYAGGGLLATRLQKAGKHVHSIPMSEFLWKGIEDSEGIDEVVELERSRGYQTAQDQITTYLSDQDWCPLADLLASRLQKMNPETDMVFLTRTASMGPGIYHMSKLLDQMQGKATVITILFYPGSIEGTTGLRFMALKDRDALGNYRVKIYG